MIYEQQQTHTKQSGQSCPRVGNAHGFASHPAWKPAPTQSTSPPPMSPQQRPRRRQPLARRLNFNNVEITERNFFNQIKTILRPYHPNVAITNTMIRTQMFPEDVSNMLGRNLTNQELRWLGAARRGTENNKPKTVNISALMAKYNVSPLKRQRENNATNYYDNTFTPRSPQKVRNKVFLLTEAGQVTVKSKRCMTDAH
jgi:hypothetical protein